MALLQRVFCLLLLSQLPHISSAQDLLSERYYQGDFPYVIQSASQRIQSGDTSFTAFYLKALSEIQIGSSNEAIQTLLQAASFHPGDLRLERMLAHQYFESGDYTRAKPIYQALVQQDTSDISSWLKLADIASFRQKISRSG